MHICRNLRLWEKQSVQGKKNPALLLGKAPDLCFSLCSLFGYFVSRLVAKGEGFDYDATFRSSYKAVSRAAAGIALGRPTARFPRGLPGVLPPGSDGASLHPLGYNRTCHKSPGLPSCPKPPTPPVRTVPARWCC